MTTADAELRLRIAKVALQTITKRHTAAVIVGRPSNRAQAVAKFRAADDIRRAEAEYQAAVSKFVCTYCAESAVRVEDDGEAFCAAHWARECVDADQYQEAPIAT